MSEERVELEAQVAECDAALAEIGEPLTDDDALAVARASIDKGRALARLRRREAALDAYAAVDPRLADLADAGPAGDELRERAAFALGETARWLATRRAPRDGADACAALIRRFGTDSEDPRLRTTLARAMANRAAFLERAGDPTEALAAADAFLAVYAENPPPDRPALVVTVHAVRARVLRALGRAGEAAAAEADLVEGHGDSADSVVRRAVERELQSFVRRAETARDWAEVERLSVLLIGLFADDLDDEIAAEAVAATYNRATALQQLGEVDAAIALWQALAERHRDDPPVGLPAIAVDAAYAAALALRRAGRRAEADEAAARLVDHHEESATGAARLRIVDALLLRRNLASEAGRDAEARALEAAALARCRDQPEIALRGRGAGIVADQVARCLRAGDAAEARRLTRELLVDLSGEADAAGLAETGPALLHAAGALLGSDLGVILSLLHPGRLRPDRLLSTSLSAARHPVGTTVRWLGLPIRHRRNLDAAIDVFDHVIARCDAPEDPRLDWLAAKARFQRAFARLQLGDPRCFRETGRWLQAAGDRELAALDAWAAWLERGQRRSDRAELAGVLFGRMFVLRHRGDDDTADAVREEILTRFADDPSPRVQAVRRLARSLPIRPG